MIHSVFAYYMTYVINKLMDRLKIAHGWPLFVPVLILTVICVYLSSVVYERLIQIVSKGLELFLQRAIIKRT